MDELKLPVTQLAALERLKTEKSIAWSDTTSVEARALNALVSKGYAEKFSNGTTHYKIKTN